AVVLLPGALLARTFGTRSVSAVVGWGFAVIFAAWAVVFTFHWSIDAALWVLAAIGVGALLAGVRRRPRFVRPGGRGLVFAGGVVLGIALWHVADAITGDALFHLARVRKLLDLGDLHLRTVDEVKDRA